MRILHVTPYFAPAFCYGGPPRSILGLSRALIKRNLDVEVFTTTANLPQELDPSTDAPAIFEGVPTRRFPLSFPRRFFGASGLSRALSNAIRHFDLVHVHGVWNVPGYLACWHAHRQKKPYIISPRGMLTDSAMRIGASRKRVAYALLDRRNLLQAAALHATSDQESMSLRQLLPGKRTFTVPNGIDPPDEDKLMCDDWRGRLGLGAAPMILFLGRIHRIKRLDLLASAFRLVHRRHPDAALILAGAVEPGCKASLKDLIASTPNTTHLGVLENDNGKWNLLRDSDVLVLCSDSENFGVCVAEALCAGTPAVATRTCPWAVLETSGSGLWVEQNAAAIASGILRIIEDRNLASIMGANGKALASRLYCWDGIADRIVEEYRLTTAERV